MAFALMTLDWGLTIFQARAAAGPFREHYGTYPVDTVEGNPLWQTDVARRKFLSLRFLFAALFVAALTGFMLTAVTDRGPALLYLGILLGNSLVLISVHVGNVITYSASRRGLRGRILIHQRLGYVMAAGRYLGLAFLLGALALVVGHPFLAGAALAAALAALRQLVFRRRVPPITE